MSVIELKEKMHNQIDLLFDVSDINDLAANIDYFFQSRSIQFDSNSPVFVGKLKDSLKQNVDLGVSSEQLRDKVGEWLTK